MSKEMVRECGHVWLDQTTQRHRNNGTSVRECIICWQLVIEHDPPIVFSMEVNEDENDRRVND